MPAARDESRPSGEGLARLVRSYRFRAGLSQESLARASGLSPRTIRQLESGRSLPRASTIRELADALDLADDERRDFTALAQPDADPVPVRGSRPSEPVVPRQLPAAPRGFVGRDAELDELGRSAGADVGPLWCITGAGGIGKTWLALRWAHGNADGFPDGQLYVNLRGFEPESSPVAVDVALRQLLYALNVEPATLPDDVDSRAGLYRSLLADKRVLVVLDNARGADQVIPLLPGAPGCAIVVTSRNDLAGLVATHGARQLVLDTLDDSDTSRMLRTQVGGARISAEPAACAELSRFCAGLPLAMGILAARAAANPRLPLSELAARLRSETERLDALDSGDISTSLRGVLSSSYRLLGPEAARVFRVLGLVPASGIGLAAVTSLAGEPIDRGRGLLRELEVARLVEQHVPGRYRMHDLTHLYAAERARHDLTEQERDEALSRVIDHYLHTADAGSKLIVERLVPVDIGAPIRGCLVEEPPDVNAALTWFETEYSNVLAVENLVRSMGRHDKLWHFAFMLGAFRWNSGHSRDHFRSWERVAAEASADPHARMWSLFYRGRILVRLERYEEATRFLDEALTATVELAEPAIQALTFEAISWLCYRRGDAAGGAENSRRAVHIAHDRGLPGLEADFRNALGWNLAHLGEYDEARDHCERAAVTQREIGDNSRLAQTLDSLGYIALNTGSPADAVSYYAESVELLHQHGHTLQEAGTLQSLGDAYRELGNDDRARVSWEHALTLFRRQRGFEQAQAVAARLAGLPNTSGSTSTPSRPAA